MSVKKMSFDFLDNLYFLGKSPQFGYQLVKFDRDKKSSIIIHSDNKRKQEPIKEFLPDFTFDEKMNVYITDTIDYRVYKYSPKGQFLQIFSKGFKKLKILENDFNVFLKPGKIEKIPNHERALERLEGDSRYFPALFGINIDGNCIYLWCTEQDEERKYLVDVYDLNFNYKCSTSHYNNIGNNLVVIKHQILYIPNIESESKEIRNSIGRLGIFNNPFKLSAYKISSEIIE